MTDFARDDICMNCIEQHKRYLHNADGCQVPGCGCPLPYTEPRTNIDRKLNLNSDDFGV